MEIKDLGTVTRCVNPEKDCQNILDPASVHVIVYRGKPLALCGTCGPIFQPKKVQEKD
jgi:hypothetical protein